MEKENLPKECKMGIVDSKKYYKVFTTLFQVGNYRYGFWQEQSSVDAIRVVKQIIEKCYEEHV